MRLLRYVFFVVLFVIVQVAGFSADCRQYATLSNGKCVDYADVPEWVVGAGLQTRIDIRNTSSGLINFDLTFMRQAGWHDISGEGVYMTTPGTDKPRLTAGTAHSMLSTDYPMIVSMLYRGVCDVEGTCIATPDVVKSGSLRLAISATSADILDAQSEKAEQATFMYMPDGVTPLWHVETSFVRESTATSQWGVNFTQTSADKMVSQTSSDVQFHILNLDKVQSVLVQVLDGNTVIASAHTKVLNQGESFGTQLSDLFGTSMFPTKDFSGDFHGTIRFKGEVGGKIIPWPKVVVAGFYPITLTPWTE